MSSQFKSIAKRIFAENLYLKVFALGLTFLLYIWVGVNREVTETFEVPLQVNVPADLVLLDQSVDRVTLELRGRWSQINEVSPDTLGKVTINLTSDDEDGVVPISKDQVKAPPGLRVQSVHPNSVRVDLAERGTKTVEIRADIRGQPRPGYKIEKVKTIPPKIDISGPKSALKKVESVPTEVLDLTGRARSFEKKKVNLRIQNPFLQRQPGEPILVRVSITSEKAQKTFDGIPVAAVNTDRKVEVTPDSVSVTVRGPKKIVDSFEKGNIQASVPLQNSDELDAGLYEREVQIRNIPEELEVIRIYPEYFRVRIPETKNDDSPSEDSSDE